MLNYVKIYKIDSVALNGITKLSWIWNVQCLITELNFKDEWNKKVESSKCEWLLSQQLSLSLPTTLAFVFDLQLIVGRWENLFALWESGKA